ncbi:MAG: hypothetical protein AAF483_07990 [Planctomycetota bacterium]
MPSRINKVHRGIFLRLGPALLIVALCAIGPIPMTRAQTGLMPEKAPKMSSRVSPALEIEVVDPNRDARGNPAVVVTTDLHGNSQVEIPPSLIVHRYYYTGDRSFRGPDLPGGPSIVVTHHPVSGEKVYLPIQMLPGSPVVHYTSRKIEYDYGDRAVIISFPKIGKPTASYRNGRPLSEKAGKLLGVPVMKAAWTGTKKVAGKLGASVKTVGQAAGQAVGGIARPLTLPAQHLSRLIPGQVALTDPNLPAQIKENAALDQRNRQLNHASAKARLERLEIPVPR